MKGRLSAGRLGRLLVGAGALLVSMGASADEAWPVRPIRFVVPYAAGGGGDIVARVIAEKLPARLGQTVVVENRVGGGGNVGAEAVFRANPDGYTLLATPQGPLVVNKALYGKLGFDPDELAPVSLVAAAYSVLVVNPKVPAQTVAELVSLAKAQPDRLNYASSGNGTTAHLAAELFKSAAGVRIVHVPYRGTGPAVADLLAGQVDLMVSEVSAAGPYIRDGRLRALAVGSEKPNPLMPGVPPLADTFPGMVAMTWHGLVAPPSTPAPIVARLAAAVSEVVAQPETVRRLAELGVVGIGGNPAELARFMRQERERWGRVIRDNGVKPAE
jgi:tripartite-type tricarboxylate transporter receptor subunit TctC